MSLRQDDAAAASEQKVDADTKMSGILDSKVPVFLPWTAALSLTDTEFEAYLDTLQLLQAQDVVDMSQDSAVTSDGTEADDAVHDAVHDAAPVPAPKQGIWSGVLPFMKTLEKFDPSLPPKNFDAENKMYTENNDVAFRSAKNELVDLFDELEGAILATRLESLLDAAWAKDPASTLRIIFNGRSIHLGKASRLNLYRSFGWLRTKHPKTFLLNLRWLVRPVILKKVAKEGETEDDLVVVEPDGPSFTAHDVKDGVAHGYWKDLLNLLSLDVNGQMTIDGDYASVLGVKVKKGDRQWDQSEAKAKRHASREYRDQQLSTHFADRDFYCAFHLVVARLFAEQLTLDKKLLASNKVRKISLAAKWAPSLFGAHDKQTLIATSIAEALHPPASIVPQAKAQEDRAWYLPRAREAYHRLTLAPLRKALGIVERDITNQTFTAIKYERVPSVAMNKYADTFAFRDADRFEAYINDVVAGKARISGATLFPSTLVSQARGTSFSSPHYGYAMAQKIAQSPVNDLMLDGQWNALVQRIKDSGTLESSIAVCDTSGSMGAPRFSDGTTPLDSAIGLSMLVAQATAAPFGGGFITFSARPRFVSLGDGGFVERVKKMSRAHWDMNTDLDAVFTKLLLPMAIQNKLTQQDMVKRIFIFSDMQFDQATNYKGKWEVARQRIALAYRAAGYEVPELVFWNLASGSSGAAAPKQATVEDGEGTALVSGYSQGMLKVFLAGGNFAEDEDEIVDEDKESAEGDDDTLVEVQKKKRKMDPLQIVMKAISHEAYSMLKVVD
ncbi:hypothetical protein FH972_022677 [Carpinus fangiana]|uniref:DUF2828 domain-containing protein n=1 Tax=Carpinus fangiana TaxID=176857 RepID=A0A5N6KV61_9ROSI|nr:hypothetical protein FH972_022677 [Carpinus fangiana]